jgi:hypothetical protein
MNIKDAKRLKKDKLNKSFLLVTPGGCQAGRPNSFRNPCISGGSFCCAGLHNESLLNAA